jgi:hypothetical protein
MNSARHTDFHLTFTSSFPPIVERLWKLCIVGRVPDSGDGILYPLRRYEGCF